MKPTNSNQEPTRKDKKFLRVGLLFCLVVNLFYALYWYFRDGFAFLALFTSYVVTTLIQLSGLQAIRDRFTIYLAHSTWEVTTECTALLIVMIFTAFVFVYPSTFKEKGIALLAGIPFIFGSNIMRLYIMAWIDYLKPQYSELFHDYIWQGLFIMMVVYMWLVWIDKVVNRETKIPIPS